MKYGTIVKATFLSRPNRFVARVRIDGVEETVHVKNTGRCGELLIPGAAVYLEDRAVDESGAEEKVKGKSGVSRKTRYDLVGVERRLTEPETHTLMINMDSQAPNRVAAEAFAGGRITLPGTEEDALTRLQTERTFGDSRFDLYLEYASGKKAFVEVKGVTLLEGEAARFPDAPTLRGVKHVNELCRAVKEGFLAGIVFVIQMKGAVRFEPNERTQPEFGEALRRARRQGVAVLAYDCEVGEDCLEIGDPVEVYL